MTSNKAQADLIYTLTGSVNPFDFDDASPQVSAGETYTAIFEIDDSVVSSEPLDSGRGVFNGAITSSSISFSGGFSSAVDFSGGDLTVIRDSFGSLISLAAPPTPENTVSGFFVVFEGGPIENPTAIPNAPQEIFFANSVFGLNEEDGQINGSFTPVNLTVTNAVPEPSVLGLLGMGLVVTSLRRRRS